MRARLPAVASPGTTQRRAAAEPPCGRRDKVLGLQRTAGNAAVSAMLAPDPATGPNRDGSLHRASLLTDLTHTITGQRPTGPVLQRDLAADVRGMVDIMGPPDYNGLIARIRAASVADRQAVLADSAVMTLIGNRFARQWATTVASALLEGTRKWKNPTDNDFFRFFVLGTGSGPANPSSTMNCWESIMYAAYLTGAVTAPWIKTFYVNALAQPDPNTAAYALLGWTDALPTYNVAAGRVPTTGQLVFYRTGSGVPGHVAIYLGGGQIMSLWTKPNGVDHIQQVGITDIAGTIYIGNPPW